MATLDQEALDCMAACMSLKPTSSGVDYTETPIQSHLADRVVSLLRKEGLKVLAYPVLYQSDETLGGVLGKILRIYWK